MRKASFPPASQSGESRCNCGRLTFTAQVTAWVRRLVGSLRTRGVLSRTSARTQLLPFGSDWGRGGKLVLVAPLSATPLVSHWTLRRLEGGRSRVRLEPSDL